MKLPIEYEVDLPAVPNFIRLSRHPNVTRAEMRPPDIEEKKISIADLSTAQLSEIGEAWTMELIAKATRIRTGKEGQ